MCCFETIQAQTININNEPIQNIIQKIEEVTAYRFNYNPNILDQFTYTGQLLFGDIESTLKTIQSQTPLQFEQQDSTILVILPKQKNKNICGYLFCESEDVPLAFANVYFKFSKTGVATNKDGFFETEATCYDDEPVFLSYIGYEDKELQISLFEKKNCPTIELSPNENTLNIGLVVKDYILPSVEEGKTYSAVSLNYKRMVEEENFLDSDVLQNIQILPGVNSFDDSATNISIRGNNSGHNITRWENVQLYNTGHFFGMLSAINPYLVDGVQVYKSSFHPSLGNTIGGVIDISLSDKIAKKFSGGIGSDMTKVFGYAKIPLVKHQLALSLSAQHSVDELFESPTLSIFTNKIFQNILLDDEQQKEEDYEERLETEIQFYDIQAKLNYKPTPKWSFNTSFFNAVDVYEYYSETDEDQFFYDEKMRINSSAIQAEMQIKPNTKNHLKAFASRSSYNNEGLLLLQIEAEDYDEAFDDEMISNEIISTEIGLQYALRHHKNWLTDFSINTENKKLWYAIKERSFYEENDIEEADTQQVFLIHQDLNTVFSNNRWTIDLGTRNTWYHDIQSFFLSPRANVQYKLNKALKLKIAAGWHYQFVSHITKFDRNSIETNPIWYLNTNERDEVLNSRKLALGAVYNQNQWLIDIEAYLQKNKNLPGFSTNVESEDAIDFFGEGAVQGIDVLVHKKWKTLTLWANYTLSKNQYTFTDLEIMKQTFPAPHDNRHNLSFNSNYKYKNWQCSIQYYLRSALPYSSPPTVYGDPDDDEDDIYLKYNTINDLRLPGLYSRLDAAISYNHSFFNNAIHFNGRLTLTNVLNKKNYESIDYHLAESEDEQQPKPIPVAKFLLPATPQVTLHFSW